MNEKEISEIRRRYKLDKNNITHIRGCYVNEKREIVSQFDQSLNIMQQDEAENILSIVKRTLSGTLEKNLINITFSTQQVVESPEHKLLMTLKNSSLNDDIAVKSFFEQVISVLNLEGNYVILLTHDIYDVPYRAVDGEKFDDASTDVFSYILCSICPLKIAKPALSYYPRENEFHNTRPDWTIAPPQLGFLFPTFDDRSANIYDALYYSRDTAQSHNEFVDAIFKSDIPMPAQEQKETFQAILTDALADECNYDVVQTVHGHLCEMIEEHKVNKEEIPLVISKDTVKKVLEDCGISESKVAAFNEKYDSDFGTDTKLSPQNIVDVKLFQLNTPNVKINVAPEYSNLVETRIIDGEKYILIRADDGVEVNGICVNI